LSLAAFGAIIAAVFYAGVLSTTNAVLNPGATFTVNSAGDLLDADPNDGLCQAASLNGECTLRAAIQQVNARVHPDKEADTIAFNIPGPGPHTIRPQSPLPALLGQVTIDGYTQADSVPDSNPLDFANDAVLQIELDGSLAGPDANGLAAEGDRQDWNRVNAITIRGLVINRFSANGMHFRHATVSLVGNFIGTDASGENDLGNAGSGVVVIRSFAPWIVENVLSGNNEFGLYEDYASGSATSRNQIGTNAAGTAPIGNALGGAVLVWGGDFSLSYNVISGNSGPGVKVVHGNELYMQGNLIGTRLGGVDPIGNKGSGVVFAGSFQFVSFGTSGNTIAYNGGDGLEILDSASQIGLGHNSIHSNAGLGIDLGGDGVTRNDRLDLDEGPNFLQNFPDITVAQATASGVTIKGSLHSGLTPSYPYHNYAISLYTNPECDASGYGEGRTYLGSIAAITDSRGRARFEVHFPVAVPADTFITATADANTWEDGMSEFSRCRRVTGRRY